jgi:uncharacterized glyoxalase superfamily protein PhnB
MADTIAAHNPAARLKSAVPTFLVGDVGWTAEWYAQALGFRTAGTVPDGQPFVYASLERDGVEIMLLRLPGYQKQDLTALRSAGVWDAYVRMEGVHAFYEAVRDQPFILASLAKQSYGDWEFMVRDPNGYILVFSEASEGILGPSAT